MSRGANYRNGWPRVMRKGRRQARQLPLHQGHRTLYVNPEGGDYARYVARAD
ncbi:hypothetical protein RSgd_p0500 (plasmid) [Ralstonia solanacearum]